MKKRKSSKPKGFPIGSRVRTVGHVHPDVMPNTRGVIDCKKDNGYGVKITGKWLIAGSDNGSKIEETRVVWFAKKNLRSSIL